MKLDNTKHLKKKKENFTVWFKCKLIQNVISKITAIYTEIVYPSIFYISTSTNISFYKYKNIKKSGLSEDWLYGYRYNEGLC